MTSAGTITLAEFLPLLHLNLITNVLGAMATSSGSSANRVMRCLELNIPENDHRLTIRHLYKAIRRDPAESKSEDVTPVARMRCSALLIPFLSRLSAKFRWLMVNLPC